MTQVDTMTKNRPLAPTRLAGLGAGRGRLEALGAGPRRDRGPSGIVARLPRWIGATIKMSRRCCFVCIGAATLSLGAGPAPSAILQA